MIENNLNTHLCTHQKVLCKILIGWSLNTLPSIVASSWANSSSWHRHGPLLPTTPIRPSTSAVRRASPSAAPRRTLDGGASTWRRPPRHILQFQGASDLSAVADLSVGEGPGNRVVGVQGAHAVDAHLQAAEAVGLGVVVAKEGHDQGWEDQAHGTQDKVQQLEGERRRGELV